MQKRIITDIQANNGLKPDNSLDLEAIAEVEVTSEHPEYPIEAALLANFEHGWRAGAPGNQTIRLLFKQPQYIHAISLDFQEDAVSRTQEYTLYISRCAEDKLQEIVRQQWNFDPNGSTMETELHNLAITDVNFIELQIRPDISNQSAVASLEKLRVY